MKFKFLLLLVTITMILTNVGLKANPMAHKQTTLSNETVISTHQVDVINYSTFIFTNLIEVELKGDTFSDLTTTYIKCKSYKSNCNVFRSFNRIINYSISIKDYNQPIFTLYKYTSRKLC